MRVRDCPVFGVLGWLVMHTNQYLDLRAAQTDNLRHTGAATHPLSSAGLLTALLIMACVPWIAASDPGMSLNEITGF